MPSSFWNNTIWYLLLHITSIITMIFVLKKSGNRKFTVVFTLATLGLDYLIESLLLISFNSYSYYPKITDDWFLDSVFGNIFSQISVSSTSALIIVYGLTYKWYFIFAFIYFLIEELFGRLGIFQQYWYKSIYTLIGFSALFWFVKMWHDKLIRALKYYIHYITLFLSTLAAVGNTIIMPFRLLNIRLYTVNFYNDLSKNHTTTALIYLFFLINILINLHRWRLHPAWKGVVFVFLFIIQYILYKSGVIYIKDGWFLTVTLFDFLGTYIWIAVLDGFLKKKPLTFQA